MEKICAICGEELSKKLSYKLSCGTETEPHEFHYECLIKSFNHSYNVERDRKCPYCREKTDYLPLVNGLKKVIPGIHCSYSFYELKIKKEELKEYNITCKHILTRGKRKNEFCGKNCCLGSEYCNIHEKLSKKSQLKFDSKQKFIVKKEENNAQ